MHLPYDKQIKYSLGINREELWHLHGFEIKEITGCSYCESRWQSKPTEIAYFYGGSSRGFLGL